jgi:para-aminobenzoate synthetase component 1
MATVGRRGTDATGQAWFAGLRLAGAVECIDLADPSPMDRGGVWVVVAEFEGPGRAWRFRDVERAPDLPATPSRTPGASWKGPESSAWESSMTREQYVDGVGVIRKQVRAGEVYQVNLCRVLRAPLGSGRGEPSASALGAVLGAEHPARYAGGIHVPAGSGVPPVWVVSASPELFLRVADGWISSGPIKGTATTPEGMSDKDVAENIMITDMVRNDLQRVCRPGSVEVSNLLELQTYPGLVHLVSTVTGRLLDVSWSEVLAATFPPASVSGAPKHTALRAIDKLEPVARGPYCGAFGWVDADAGRAELAVAIRSFWWDADDRALRFGTGAGITWGSDPEREWAETELKAELLVNLASGSGDVATPGDRRGR